MIALLINSLNLGGAERIVLNIHRGLIKNQHEAVIICLIENTFFKIPVDTKVIYLSKQSEYKRGMRLNKLFLFPVMVFKLMKTIRKYKIDIVQSHLYSASMVNICAKLLGSSHQAQIVNHSYVSYERTQTLLARIKLAALKFTYQHADLVVSLNRKMQEDVNKTLLRNSRIENTVIPNPHDISAIKKQSTEEITDFSFDKGNQYLVTAGRLMHSKRLDILLLAFAELHKQLDNLRLIILGDGDQLPALRKICADNNLLDYVSFLGHVKNPHKYIAKSDIFILTSEREGSPNILFEAMVCQTPVISADCLTGPREILSPASDFRIQLKEGTEIGDNGILIPLNAVDPLINAVKMLLQDDGLRNRLITNGSAFAGNYALDKVITQYEKILA